MKNFKGISGTWMMMIVAVTLVFSGCSSDDNERFTELTTPTGGSEGVVDAEAHSDLAYFIDNMDGNDMLVFVKDMFATLQAGHEQGPATQEDWNTIWTLVHNLYGKLAAKQADLNKAIIESEDAPIDVDPALVRSIGDLLNTAFDQLGNGADGSPNFLMADVIPMLDYVMGADAALLQKAIDGLTLGELCISETDYAPGITALSHLLNTGAAPIVYVDDKGKERSIENPYREIYVELDALIERLLNVEDDGVRWDATIGEMKDLVVKMMDCLLYPEDATTLDKIRVALKAIDTTKGLGLEARGVIGAALDLVSVFDVDKSLWALRQDINGLKTLGNAVKTELGVDNEELEQLKFYLFGAQAGETTAFETELLTLVFNAVDLPDDELNPGPAFADGTIITDETPMLEWIRHLAGFKVEDDAKVSVDESVYDVLFLDGKIVVKTDEEGSAPNALAGLTEKLDGVIRFVLVDNGTGTTALAALLDELLEGQTLTAGYIQSVFGRYDIDGDGVADPSLVEMMLAVPNMDADMSGVIFDVIDIIQGKNNKQDKLTIINGLCELLHVLDLSIEKTL